MIVTIFQLQKRSSYKYQNIQDKYALNQSNLCFAIADGTTQSFNSEKWAEILTQNFVSDPVFEPEALMKKFTACVPVYKEEKFEFSTNIAKASLEKTKMQKGGTATFMGIQFSGDYIEIVSCGDTNFFIKQYNDVECFPFCSVNNLNENNFFINTEQLINEKIDASFFYYKKFFKNKNDTYIIATDALSRLFLKNSSSTLDEFISISSFDGLYTFCMKYWERKELEEDDISAFVIKNIDENKDRYIIPPPEFSFPKEEETEFLPNPGMQQQTLNNFSDMQMQEIMNQFNGVANDFKKVKKNQKFTVVLIAIVIIMIFCSTMYSFLFQSKSVIDDKTNNIEQLNENLNKKDIIIKAQNEQIENFKKQIEKQNEQLKELQDKIYMQEGVER